MGKGKQSPLKKDKTDKDRSNRCGAECLLRKKTEFRSCRGEEVDEAYGEPGSWCCQAVAKRLPKIWSSADGHVAKKGDLQPGKSQVPFSVEKRKGEEKNNPSKESGTLTDGEKGKN